MDLVVGRARVRLDERGGRHDLTGRAEAALHGVGANERMDEGMVAQPFDRRHLAIADCMDERDAGERRHAVELHGAGAAMSLTARDFGPREAEVLAQHLCQRAADGRVERMDFAVDPELRQELSPPRCPQGG